MICVYISQESVLWVVIKIGEGSLIILEISNCGNLKNFKGVMDITL
jgi:hypothetical protein